MGALRDKWKAFLAQIVFIIPPALLVVTHKSFSLDDDSPMLPVVQCGSYAAALAKVAALRRRRRVRSHGCTEKILGKGNEPREEGQPEEVCFHGIPARTGMCREGG